MHAAKQVRSVPANLFGLQCPALYFSFPKRGWRCKQHHWPMEDVLLQSYFRHVFFFQFFSAGVGQHKKVSTVLTVSFFSGLCNLTQNFMRVRVTWSNWCLLKSACNCIQLIPLWFKFLSIYWWQTMGAVSSWYLLCIQPRPYSFLLYSVPPTPV